MQRKVQKGEMVIIIPKFLEGNCSGIFIIKYNATGFVDEVYLIVRTQHATMLQLIFSYFALQQ